MDIARPDLRQIKRRHQITTAGAAVLLLVAVTAAMSRLKPAVPSVERGSIWTDTVKRGSMLRQVRGLGTLVPRQEDVRLIPAESAATVLRILKLPGSHVKGDTILLEMSNLQLEQEALDTELQLKAAEAEYQNLQVKLESDLMNEKSSAATVGADYNQAKRQAEADKALYEQGVISALAYKASQGKAGELSTRNDLEAERLTINQKAIHSQMDVQRAKVEQMHALAKLKRRQLDNLKVRAGIDGVLVDQSLQVGQRVLPGTVLAKVVRTDHLMARLNIPETEARDVQLGETVSVDTHNGMIQGSVVRIDPAVQNGAVAVDVGLSSELPKGVRPELSVDGTIDLERLDRVLYLGRPVFGKEDSKISLFRMDADGKGATRVPVKMGHASVSSIQVLDGLREGDSVILSDMSRFDIADRIRVE